MMLLQDKVAIITGGTRGIGFATVEKFLENGAKVALMGSRKETVDAALSKLAESHPDAPVIGLYPNLADREAVVAAFAEVVDKWGRLDILINNAGISQATPFLDYQPDEFVSIMNINVVSVFNCSYAAAAHMKEQGGGVILNTSSVVSQNGQQSGCGYPTSKFAVNGLTRSLSRELGPMKIRVNAVLPGVTETDMVEALPTETKAYLSQTIPLGRLGTAGDVANAFLFLASDMASYITGAELSVDGGIII